ncbi:S-adenosyl-L-methionine dependent methyltransferase [Pisolithus orientalis]|uniref:S-adenosyl-L-methionine dependent methyltransferase n=1 Tax=Pisolithus orientalis TaxID=936130 RepID=UPI0022247774|nr:S-adenosyl-L-methionine dependent methyltransferase [Pisolithus orientalis]KAI6035112.1 S-adenosyl-L-methionine dependent methyltransferase [Pisolithus orientalis]
MHPRNIYAASPDFVALARSYPPLRPYVFLTHTGPSIDFKNPIAQRRLTEALLRIDFDISLSLPENRLCPPVIYTAHPYQRLNYVLWIQDIIRETAPDVAVVRGIDIGTGASTVYPLLACRLEPTWQFVATDVDKDSLTSARENDRVIITETSPSKPLLFPLEKDTTVNARYEFTMCNPPFYSSTEEMAQSAETKEFGPNAVCTGAEVEMITPGGEVAFVSRIIMESLRHKARCRWYTSMLGKMISLHEIVSLLRNNLVDNYAITEFVQGQTRRWAIAWSFGTRRLPDVHARISSPALQGIMPLRTTLYQPLPNITSTALLSGILSQVLADVDGVSVTLDNSSSGDHIYLVRVSANTWSRSARRKKTTAPLQTDMPLQSAPVMQCRIQCRHGLSPTVTDNHKLQGAYLDYQWIDGKERSIFESFVSHVNRKAASSRLTNR